VLTTPPCVAPIAQAENGLGPLIRAGLETEYG